MVVYAVIYQHEVYSRSRAKLYSDTIVAICESMDDAEKIKENVYIAPEDKDATVFIQTYDTNTFDRLISGDYKVFVGSYDKVYKLISIKETKIMPKSALNVFVDNDITAYIAFLARDFGDAESTFRDRLEYFLESNKSSK